MGFRFRQSLKIMPGVRLNFSRSGVSTSIGPRGLSLNLGKRGPRATVGMPGTGVSYSTPVRLGSGGSRLASSPFFGWLGLAGVVAFFIPLAFLPKDRADEANPRSSSPVGVDELVYVTASSLNCRASPSLNATVVTRMAYSSALSIAGSRGGGWREVIRPEGNCWVAARYLAVMAPPAREPHAAGAASARLRP